MDKHGFKNNSNISLASESLQYHREGISTSIPLLRQPLVSKIKEVKSVWGISEKGQREENFRERSPICTGESRQLQDGDSIQ